MLPGKNLHKNNEERNCCSNRSEGTCGLGDLLSALFFLTAINLDKAK